MKKSYLFFLLIFSIINTGYLLKNSDHYYWYNGKQIHLKIKNDKKYVLFDHKPKSIKNSNVLKQSKSIINDFNSKDENSLKYWAVINKSEISKSLNDEYIYEAPFFEAENGKELGLSHLFYVKLFKLSDTLALKKLSLENNIEILGNNKFMPLWFTLSCSKNSKGNALELANKFYESSLFSAAEPDLMEDDIINCSNEPLFNNQWNLKNTGQFGGNTNIDINICQAWEITTGNPNIIVAVVDAGIELNHPDLSNVSAISFDTESGTSPSQVLGNHGTAVSGIIGARSNNLGIVGVAPNATLMSISNSLAGTPNSRMTRADGINFAYINGASVINNSWGSSVPYQVIDDAISNAVNFGRGGLGTVVIFSAGNNNQSSIGYPSTNSNVLSVGAMSMCGERKNPSSCDNEDWGSNYGTGLDVIAPGVRISTTDRQGTLGYNTNATTGNYHGAFNGTSAAAPHVAGIAALILSVNCELTQQQVRNIIESSTDKLTGYNYTSGSGENTNLTWNSETGYGKVNAFKAVTAALPHMISGANQLCYSENYTIPNLPTGATVIWSVSPSYLVTSTTSGNSITLTKAYNGDIALSATVSSACGDINLSPLTIKVGAPVFDFPRFTNLDNDGQYWCSNAIGNSFTIENTNHTDVYEARLLSYPNLTVFATNNNAYPGQDVFSYVPAGYYVFQIRATNNCGTSDWIETEVESLDCSYNYRVSNYNVYPNPASSDLTIEYAPIEESSNNKTIRSSKQKDIKLFNYKGEIIVSSMMKENEKKVVLDTKNVPDGTYYLHITEGKETIKKQIIIKH